MKFKWILRLFIAVFIIGGLTVNDTYSAPKKNEVKKARKKVKEAVRNSEKAKRNNTVVNTKASSAARGKSISKKTFKQQVTERKRNEKVSRENKPKVSNRQRNLQKNQRHVQGKILRDLDYSLKKLNNLKFANHPKDDRGQGNMGKVDMLDPYGFSKDDRMELYGNRGRIIRISEPEPVPEPIPPEPEPIPPPPPEPEPIPEPPPEPEPIPPPEPDPVPEIPF